MYLAVQNIRQLIENTNLKYIIVINKIFIGHTNLKIHNNT